MMRMIIVFIQTKNVRRCSTAEKGSSMCMLTEPTESDSPGTASREPSASVMIPSLPRWYPTRMPSSRSERPLDRMNRRPPLRKRAQGLNGTRLGALKLAKVEFAMV